MTDHTPVDTRTILRHWSGYKVDDQGVVYSKTTGRPLRASPHQGYLRVQLHYGGRHKWHKVHILVLETFIGPRPPGLVGRHIDGDAMNCRLGNLAWSTQKVNIEDKRIHGTMLMGETHPQARLTADEVREIRTKHASGEGPASLAQTYGIRPNYVNDIVARRNWKHI